jgi:acetate kinase
VLDRIRELSALAPLHNPAAAIGIEAARKRFDVPHVAVFDTAFFSSLPPEASTYAVPRDLAEKHAIRRYGFHGTSHQYVAQATADLLGRPVEDLRQVILHLGNGCSASAVRGGRAVDTSMGLTPLEGLVMGTRSGDVDPGLHAFLGREAGLSLDEIDTLLNKKSGVLGLSGVNDFRELERRLAAGDADARLAFDVVVHRLKHYVGAYLAILGGIDALVFTAGVGENSISVRAAVTDGLEGLGIEVDRARNAARSTVARVISPTGATVVVAVVPTNEELAIARQTADLVG